MTPKVVPKNELVAESFPLNDRLQVIVNAAILTAPPMLGGEIVVTSAGEGEPGDGVHKLGSLHYLDRALDLRVWNIDGDWMEEGPRWADRIRQKLEEWAPGEYDVVFELRPHTTPEGEDALVGHIHGEYDSGPAPIVAHEESDMDERDRTAGPIEGAARGGLGGGLAGGLMTGDPQTAVLIALITGVFAGLGNWGRKHQDADGIKGFLAAIFGVLGG